MIKKIKVEQLRPGMYIHDLDCGWLQHPFLRSNLRVKNQKTIDKIVGHGIREVYIDTTRGSDEAQAPSQEEVRRSLEVKMAEVVDSEPMMKNRVSRREELKKARHIQMEAKKVVGGIMEDVRMGQQIERERVEHVVEQMTDSIFRNKDALISLSRLKQKDEYTFMHSVSVCVLMISFSRELGFELELINQVGVGALLHDIGKMRIPDAILNKPGRLTDKEFEKMKEHVTVGVSLLEETSNFSPPSLSVVAEHHERHDGTGYPKGLKEDDVTVFGQMASIVDVYDAMTSERCYKSAMEPTEALRKIFEWSTYHFKDEMVHRFIRCVGIYPVGTLVRLERGLLGVVIEPGAETLLRPVVRVIYDANERVSLPPYDVDLSRPEGPSDGYHILGSESPKQWGISPHAYIDWQEEVLERALS